MDERARISPTGGLLPDGHADASPRASYDAPERIAEEPAVTYRRYRSSHGAGRVAPLLGLLAIALVAAAAAARAQAPGAPDQETIAAGVSIGRVEVGGLTIERAAAAVEASFRRPLELELSERTVTTAPSSLGARLHLYPALEAAAAAPEDARIPLRVSVEDEVLSEWTRKLAASYARPAREPRVTLRGARPRVIAERDGRKLAVRKAVPAIEQALRRHARKLELPIRTVPSRRTTSEVGPVVVIRRDTHRLVLYDGARRVRRLGVAVGQAAYPTPLGSFRVVSKQRYPWWYPPDSDWAAGAVPIPPGPGNPLGTRWMGLSSPSVGIHGTPDAASIGYSASHGCIRMRIADAEWLFERVKVGTPVFIVAK